MPSAECASARLLDLEELESDPAPLFVIRAGEITLGFEFLFCNEAFRKLHLRNSILAQDRAALLFRSWAQALSEYKPRYDFGGLVWTAEISGRNGSWKVVKARELDANQQDSASLGKEADDNDDLSMGRIPVFTRSKAQLMSELKRERAVSLRNIPYTSLHARWESIQTMMEMSDVGVFEYNAEGKLLHANEAWYRLSSQPRDAKPDEYSFMDLVYPDDQALVMSMWNTLTQGKSVTFEMRWKARSGSKDAAQWKKSQEAAQAQVEALEQARLAERKFARFAQTSPTAIYIYVPESGHAHAPVNQYEWFDLISNEDVERVKQDWDGMLKCELDENGKVISIMGTLFDISHFKWAESVQRRRIDEALEAKRQQENFIDMTSHELRTVIQCADSVIASLQQLSGRQFARSKQPSDISKAEAEVQSCIESLLIIVSCSMHQKRVIDDVLTLSKFLILNLILITPMRVQPAVVVSDAVRMFEVELEWNGQCSIRHVYYRYLINLLTNAIKFTKDRPQKVITVTIGGSWSRPPKCWNEVTFTDDEKPKTDITEKAEWGEGRIAFLWLKVKDTGCGMTMDEQKKLFSRFSQATPRTHVKYGGSGLGLFISKSLTKLQGGAIGVHSEKEEGSTFAFFISTRLAHPPADHVAARAVQARPVPRRTMTGEEAMQTIKLNVLIVEDNLVNQKVLRKQLQKFGWNISVAGNGQEALEWLKDSVYWRNEKDSSNTEDKHELDIILMDIEMPIMDGLDLRPPHPRLRTPRPPRVSAGSAFRIAYSVSA
ncbi:unnamed protein product [Alternaria alternata]